MISRWARQEWEAFASALDTGDKTATQEALQHDQDDSEMSDDDAAVGPGDLVI